MNYPPLTPLVMLQQLVRLNDTWPRWEADDAQFERMSYSFHESLSDLDAEAVAGGVSIWLKTSTSNRWPSPAQVRDCAIKWITANRDFKVRWQHEEGSCPTCGAKPRWAELRATDYRTGAQGVVVRMIHPCLSERHKDGSPYVPFPDNFIQWAPLTPYDEQDAKASLQALARKYEAQAASAQSPRPAAHPSPGHAQDTGHDVPSHRGQAGREPPAGARPVPLPEADGLA